METKFQTSFIPKKPLPPVGGVTANVSLSPKPKKVASSLFFNIAVLLFIVSLGAAGGAYAWRVVSLNNQESYKNDLLNLQKQFNPALISQLKTANAKITAARNLLGNHLAVSTVFGIISQFTVEKIRFLELELVAPSGQNKAVGLTMTGQGANLGALAFQGDVLSALSNYGLTNVVQNPMISKPAPDINGTVSFGFTASIDPSAILYGKSMQQSGDQSSAPTN